MRWPPHAVPRATQHCPPPPLRQRVGPHRRKPLGVTQRQLMYNKRLRGKMARRYHTLDLWYMFAYIITQIYIYMCVCNCVYIYICVCVCVCLCACNNVINNSKYVTSHCSRHMHIYIYIINKKSWYIFIQHPTVAGWVNINQTWEPKKHQQLPYFSVPQDLIGNMWRGVRAVLGWPDLRNLASRADFLDPLMVFWGDDLFLNLPSDWIL